MKKNTWTVTITLTDNYEHTESKPLTAKEITDEIQRNLDLSVGIELTKITAKKVMK
jgi:hypothetical protein